SSTLKKYLDRVITENNLTKVGEVYHQFEGSGYTAVICLTESHISIHTWPEFNRVTFDVFLSNFMKYNNDIANSIHDGVLALLDATDVQKTVLNR
ncbi:MAG TPA: S-adenosylmethionine decarboxylase, partial [Bacteroidia bacterium]|nr:S-adenosylmethionine decarboxylase [Bacteroidia bacterium]